MLGDYYGYGNRYRGKGDDLKPGFYVRFKGDEMSDLTYELNKHSMYSEPKLISVELVNGKIEIVRRAESLIVNTANPPQYPPPRIWKEVYASHPHEVKIVLEKVIDATYIPAQPERWEFGE